MKIELRIIKENQLNQSGENIQIERIISKSTVFLKPYRTSTSRTIKTWNCFDRTILCGCESDAASDCCHCCLSCCCCDCSSSLAKQ